MFYDLLIYPIEAFIRFVFEGAFAYTNNYILTTIVLSIIVNILLLPAYNMAEKLQKKESDITERLDPFIKEFKRVYKGSELHAVTSRLYKMHNYHPIFSLRSLVGLAIQVPFFIAAYHFLSIYEPIKGVETFLFYDLGEPDNWINLGSYKINAMPFIMTIINLMSAFLYSNNKSKSTRNQTLILALIFLVLLYNSPALLLLYWTANNIFSLGKNIWKNKEKITNDIFTWSNNNTKKIKIAAFSLLFILTVVGYMQVNSYKTIELDVLKLETENVSIDNKWAKVKFSKDNKLLINTGINKPSIAKLKVTQTIWLTLDFSISKNKPGDIEFIVKKNQKKLAKFVVTQEKTKKINLYLKTNERLKIIADKHGKVSYDHGYIDIQYKSLARVVYTAIFCLIFLIFAYFYLLKKD